MMSFKAAGRVRSWVGRLPAGCRAGLSRRQWVLIALVVLALAGSVGWVVLRAETFAVRDVEVAGTGRLRPADVVEAARIPRGTPLVTVDTEEVANRVRELAPVRKVDVVRRWPRTVEIAVVERDPVAVRRAGQAYMLVDASGVGYATVRERPKGLPLISAPARVDAAGRTTSPHPRALRAALSVFDEVPASVRSQVLEVRATGPAEVTLRLTRGRIVIWGAPERGDRKGRVLDVLLTRKAKVYDVSAPDTPTTRR